MSARSLPRAAGAGPGSARADDARPLLQSGRQPRPAAPLTSRARCRSTKRQCRTHTAAADAVATQAAGGAQGGSRLLSWLQSQGAPEQLVRVEETEILDNHLDVTVADRALSPGDVALSIPENLVITLDRVFEDGAVAELLTTNKLSELACLTLYLMYEKKRGRDSFWLNFIRELDRVRGRGLQGARTPLLWDEGQVEDLLQGSPVVREVQARLEGIRREYEELDTVWFMAGSLFKSYPYDIPSEAFSLELFTQGFAAVQASVVHLQGVPLSQRFALVPLGPPLLAYSSTSKAMLQWDGGSRQVRLVVDRAYKEGEPIRVWFGPQPNQRAFLNYGIVDEANPNDKMDLQVTIPQSDPLFQAKRSLLQQHSLATQQTFRFRKDQELPEHLLDYLRFAHCSDEGLLRQAAEFAGPVSPENELTVVKQLCRHLKGQLGRYKTSIEQDSDVIADPSAGPRQKVAARLLRIEKTILSGALERTHALPGALADAPDVRELSKVLVKLS